MAQTEYQCRRANILWKIASLGEATEEIKEDEVAEETEAKEEYVTKAELAAVIEEMKAMISGGEKEADLKEEAEELSTEVEAVEEKVAEIEMSAEVVEPIAHNPEALSAPKSNLPQNTNSQLDRIRDMIYNN